ncbi:MAG: Holliday junction resolvase RuvX [Candidatus Omnitrophota bacterium]
MTRILALDIGQKRIGIAVSDALNITAQGIETLKRQDIETVLKRIGSLVKEYDVSKIVVGIPFNMDGSKGRSAALVEEFIAELKQGVSAEIATVDERLTTLEGERMLLEADVSRKKRKASIDKIAAQLILQIYLDSKCIKK